MALKMQPSHASIHTDTNAAARIAAIFMELPERQFPIELPMQQIILPSPADFASQLSVPW